MSQIKFWENDVNNDGFSYEQSFKNIKNLRDDASSINNGLYKNLKNDNQYNNQLNNFDYGKHDVQYQNLGYSINDYGYNEEYIYSNHYNYEYDSDGVNIDYYGYGNEYNSDVYANYMDNNPYKEYAKYANNDLNKEYQVNNPYKNYAYKAGYEKTITQEEYVDTSNSFYRRKGSFDNKFIPTEDIEFNDMYIVRNQLFEEQEKLFTFNDIISLAICVAFAVVVAFLVNRYAGQITTVSGTSMEYNFHDKETLVIDKLTYKVTDPKRYDAIIFPVKVDDADYEYNYYIKRIIGLPGETIYIDDTKSEIYIDGNKLTDEIYGWEKMSNPNIEVETNNITLGDDEYYVLGDNRNNSKDSRDAEVGVVKREIIKGKACFKIWPITSFGFIDHEINKEIYEGKREATPLP